VFIACLNGDVEGVKLAILQRIDVNSPHHELGRPLNVAVTNHRTQVIDVLLEAKADPNLPDTLNNTTTHYAADSHADAIVIDHLLQKGNMNVCAAGSGGTVLHDFVAWHLRHGINNDRVVTQMSMWLSKGARPCLLIPNQSGEWPHEMALAGGSATVGKFLVDQVKYFLCEAGSFLCNTTEGPGLPPELAGIVAEYL